MPIEIPEVLELRGEEAIKALSDAIAALEGQGGDELTDHQTKVLIRIAEGMISSIHMAKKRAKPKRKTGWSLFSRSRARGTQ